MVCISMMRMIMRRLICSPICHFYTFTHQFMVEPELFYPEVGSHDLVPQILNSFTMSNIIKKHSLQAQSIIIWKDVKYQYMRSNTLSIPTHPLTTSIKWHRFIGSFILHLPTFHLLGFCWDGHSRPQNRWDGSQLSPSQTPANHPSRFFWLNSISIPKWNCLYN